MKIEGSTKTALKIPWQHGEEFSLALKAGKAANGTSFGYVSFEDSTRTFPVLVLKNTRTGQVLQLFLSMLVKPKFDEHGDLVSYDAKSLNALADKVYTSAKTDEEMMKKLCDQIKGHKVICDRSHSYKNEDGKRQRLIQFYIE